MGDGLSRRLGAARRDRMAYTAMLRRSASYNFRATVAPAVAVVVVGALSVVSADPLALALCLPAAACAALQLLEHHHERTETVSRLRLVAAHQRSQRRTNGKQALPLSAW